MDKHRIEIFSLIGLFVGVSVLLFFVFKPFLVVLSLAAVFAVVLHTPYERLTRLLHGWKSVSALLIVGLFIALFVVPIFFLGVQIFQEAQNLFSGVPGNEARYVQTIQTIVEIPVRQWFPQFVFDINATIGTVLSFISNNLESLVYQTLSVLFDTFLMLLTLFFFLRDGRGLLARLTQGSPFGEKVTKEILDNLYRTTLSVVQGTLIIVLIRAACMWIAFSAFGIPSAIFWSSVGGIAGAIPGLGTAFAFALAVAYFYLQGNVLATIGMALSGIGAIILIDTILTSYFFGKGLEVSSLFILFAILGGILFFGPLGFVLGPLVLSVFIALVHAPLLAE